MDTAAGSSGPTAATGLLRRIPRAPLGMRTDGDRVLVRGSQAIRWIIAMVIGVALVSVPSGIDAIGVAAIVVFIGVPLLLNRKVRCELHRDGWVLAAGQEGLRWVATRPQARIHFFDQFSGKGTFAVVGIEGPDSPEAVEGLSITKGARTDRLGPLTNFWGASRALRILAAVDRSGCWPAGCWVDLTNAGPVIDPRGRAARRRLEAAGRTRPTPALGDR